MERSSVRNFLNWHIVWTNVSELYQVAPGISKISRTGSTFSPVSDQCSRSIGSKSRGILRLRCCCINHRFNGHIPSGIDSLSVFLARCYSYRWIANVRSLSYPSLLSYCLLSHSVVWTIQVYTLSTLLQVPHMHIRPCTRCSIWTPEIRIAISSNSVDPWWYRRMSPVGRGRKIRPISLVYHVSSRNGCVGSTIEVNRDASGRGSLSRLFSNLIYCWPRFGEVLDRWMRTLFDDDEFVRF